MSLRCFYVVDGAPVGPVSSEELLNLGQTGGFTADTLVWIEGTPDWQSFSSWSAESGAPPAPILAPVTPGPTAPEPATPEPLLHEPVIQEPVTVEAGPARKAVPEVVMAASIAAESSDSQRRQEIPASEPLESLPAPSSTSPAESKAVLGPGRAETAQENAPKARRLFWALSWLSLISLALFLATAGICLMLSPESSLAGLLLDTGPLALRVLLGLSVLSGLGALFGFRRHRTWQVIAPASVALVTSALLLVIAKTASGSTESTRSPQRNRGLSLQRSGGMTPVKAVAGANRLSHPTLAFSFDIPAGYEEYPLTKSSAKLWKLFGKPAQANELAEVFGIQLLGTKLQRHLDLRQIPTDGNVNLGRLSWRGVEIDAIRIAEAKDGKSYVTYNVQVPLKGEAIQLMLGAPREREAELKTRIETLLASLDGQSDW